MRVRVLLATGALLASFYEPCSFKQSQMSFKSCAQAWWLALYGPSGCLSALCWCFLAAFWMAPGAFWSSGTPYVRPLACAQALFFTIWDLPGVFAGV